MTWVILVLLAQFFWALGNYIDRYLLHRYRFSESASESATGTLLLVSSCFQIVVAFCFFIISISANIDLIAVPPKAMFMAIGVGVIEIIWLIPYFYALDKSDETTAAPLFQTVPIFGLVLGFFVFGEAIKPLHIVAIGTILTGSIVLNLNYIGDQRKQFSWKVINLMLLASFLIALSAFIFKSAALDTNFIAAAFWMSIGGFIVGVCIYLTVPLYRKQFLKFLQKRDLAGISINATNEVMDNLAILAFYGAVILAPSTVHAQSMIAYQPIIILFIGFVASKLGSEFHTEQFVGTELVKRVVGISIIVFGSVLILF